MEWLQNLLNGESGSAIQLVLITVVLMVVLIFVVWLFRRVAGSPTRKSTRNRVPRLSITDSTTVDDKRYLVLVRRDNVEHLVLIGGPTDVVVETNIVRVQPATQPGNVAAQPSQPAEKPVEAPAIEKPAVEENRPATSTAQAAAPVAAAAAVATAAIAQPEEETQPEPVAEPAITEAATEPAVTETPAIVEDIVEATEEIVSAEEEIVAAEPEITPDPMDDIEIEPAEPDMPEATEAAAEVNLEDAISEQLDSALSDATFEIEPDTAPETAEKPDSDNEMQRLLDELAGETKEPA